MYSRDGCPFVISKGSIWRSNFKNYSKKQRRYTRRSKWSSSFESRATGKNHTGCPKSIDQLVNALKGDTQKNTQGNNQQQNKLSELI